MHGGSPAGAQQWGQPSTGKEQIECWEEGNKASARALLGRKSVIDSVSEMYQHLGLLNHGGRQRGAKLLALKAKSAMRPL